MRDYRSMKVPQFFLDKVIAPSCNNDANIIEAFRTVPREYFMAEAMKMQAYSDDALPIGYGQTISQPSLVAMMIYHLQPSKQLKCLEIGAGSGYLSALLGKLMADVYAMELVIELVTAAQQKVRKMMLWNVNVMKANGAMGYADKAPYDRIIVSCGANSMPKPLIEQLAEGGIMLIPLNGTLTKLTKNEGTIKEEALAKVAFVDFVHT
ncbi:MAG: protein-L-isoaspartate(D-aspartate) O-methyltransferase [Deferribacteraceae bacterium]|jgi:protein-L-isoaspartate(D-aspartate) O-methyltransferase|nr:protein-L-isoaspartate(D-aspartate) O-methyltransferase [Deferribacteraceae bacterium]